MEGFRKAREEEESNTAQRAARKEEETAEAEKVSVTLKAASGPPSYYL